MEYKQFIGVSKADILEEFGSCYNDFYSSIWMFVLHEKNCFCCKKYLYIFFEQDLVVKIELRRFKAKYLM